MVGLVSRTDMGRTDASPAPLMSGGGVLKGSGPSARSVFVPFSGVGTYRYMAPEVVRYEQYTASWCMVLFCRFSLRAP